MESAPLPRFFKVAAEDGSVHILNENNIGNLEFSSTPLTAGSAVMETRYQVKVPYASMVAFQKNLFVIDPNSMEIDTLITSGSALSVPNTRFFSIVDTAGYTHIVNETYIANLEIGSPSTPSNYIVLITGTKVILSPTVMNNLLANLLVYDVVSQSVTISDDLVLTRFFKIYDNYNLLHIVNESTIANIEIGATATSACYIVLAADYKIRTDYTTCQNLLAIIDTIVV